MKISMIKKLYEKIPSWATMPLAPLIRSRLIANSEFQETYRSLMEWEELTEAERKKLQLELLKKTLIHAGTHCNYYRQLFASCDFSPEEMTSPEDLSRLPVLTREILNEHAADLQADDISDAYQVSTGGSTGSPVKLGMENKAIYREWAYVYHYWSRFGYDFRTDRLATFRGLDLKDKIADYNPLYGEIRMNAFLLSHENIGTYINKIDRFGAEFLYGYPSIIYNFCRLAEQAGIDLKGRYKAVFLVSENIYTFQAEMIEKVLKAPVAMFYGHTERAAFAEKMDHGYFFHQRYGYLEFENGRPLVTGFINRKTPLIRYQLDDTILETADSCYQIEGHGRSDMIYGKNGEVLRATVLDFHGSLSSQLGFFQLEQRSSGELYLCVLKGETSPELAEKALEDCRRRLGEGFTIELKWVDEILTTPRGKYRFLIKATDETL